MQCNPELDPIRQTGLPVIYKGVGLGRVGRAESGMRKYFRQRWLDHSSIILYCCQIKGRKYTCTAPSFPTVLLLLSIPFPSLPYADRCNFIPESHLIERLVAMPCMVM